MTENFARTILVVHDIKLSGNQFSMLAMHSHAAASRPRLSETETSCGLYLKPPDKRSVNVNKVNILYGIASIAKKIFLPNSGRLLIERKNVASHHIFFISYG